MRFPALINGNPGAIPPLEIKVYHAAYIRDAILKNNSHLPGIRSVELDFSELADDELDHVQLDLPADDRYPEAAPIITSYIDEKMARLSSVVKNAVRAALNNGGKLEDEAVWSVQFFIDGAAFSVGIHADQQISWLVVKEGRIPAERFERLLKECVWRMKHACRSLQLLTQAANEGGTDAA